MTKYRDARDQLEWMLRIGAINGWVDVDDISFDVVTADDKLHTWTAKEVLAFNAGFCAGRTYQIRPMVGECRPVRAQRAEHRDPRRR